MNPEKALAKADKEKKEKYLQACLERRSSFTNMVYSADIINKSESLLAQRRLASPFSFRLKWKCSKIYGFVRASISLEIVRSNSLLLCAPCDKEAKICQ